MSKHAQKPDSSPDTNTTAEPLWFIDNLAFVHIDGEQTTDAYSLMEFSARRGSMPPLHAHQRDETFYVIEGEMTLFSGDERIRLSDGQAGLAPRGVPLTYRVESEQARWLAINGPAGSERFVRTVSDAAPSAELPPPDRPTDPAALTEAASEYGIEILGPPGMLPADQLKSLYDRLGALDRISALVDSWVARVAGDDRANQKFVRTDIPRLKKEVVDLLCQATGGPCTYTGRNTRERYDGMKVTAGEFDAVMQALAATLDELNVPKAEQDELIGLLMPMRPEIVEIESPQTGTTLPDSYQVAPQL